MELRQVKTNTAVAGMQKDLDPQVLKDGQYPNAINSRLNTNEGDIPFISNEQSNRFVDNAPYPIIGVVKMPSGRFAIFSTDDVNSEVGLYDEIEETYTKVIRDKCLNFNRNNLIKGASKGNFDCTETVYFTDGVNPRRKLNVDDVPYKFTVDDDECKTKRFTNELDCDALLVDKKLDYPKITVEFGPDGTLKNGSYEVAVAYAIQGQVVTDWLGLTFPKKTFDHAPSGRSLEIKVENLDREFDQYAVAVVYTVDGVTAVDRVGFYSTGESNVVVTSVGRTAINNVLLTLDEIVNKRPIYTTADDVTSTSQYLLWVNPSSKDELNYQPDAMNIGVKWVAYKLPKDYYRKGGTLVGYMRDEVYTFGIQWLYSTGDWSPVFHIGGRQPEAREIKVISGRDVYEKSTETCQDEDLPFFFQVYNTAKLTKQFNVDSNFCEPAQVAEGTMAYWQSSEHYPDLDVYGDSRCTPIRHHKFPDSAIINHHDGEFPVILGVKFDNIKKPEGVVGYRILRGDRAGNRSVVAKGLLFNTGNYTDNGDAWMYPNYPYNDLRTDPFLSTTQTSFLLNEKNFNPRTDFNNDKFTFHSPSTALNKPVLGSELRIESEEIARVDGKFEEVYRHPQYKLITDFSYGIASVIAIGGAVLAIKGKKCVTAGTMPGGIDGAPRPFNYAVNCETELMGRIGIPGSTIPIPNIPGIIIAFGYYYSLGVQSVVNIIKLLSNWHQFAYQYNSHGFYNDSINPRIGNRRRRINYAQYLIPGNQDINGVKMNNFNRESSVYMELSTGLASPITVDNSRNTIGGFGICNNPKTRVVSTASSYYAAIKRKALNQYGQLDSVRYLDTGTVFDITDEDVLDSGHIFGGDTYIGRFTEKRKLTYFLNWPFDVPDGWEWDYRKYFNIPYPRFWLDGTDYDFGAAAKNLAVPLTGLIGLAGGFDTSSLASSLPSSKHNLDCYKPLKNVFVVKDRYFYLFNSGVIDYFAESEYNVDFRDWEDSIEGRHYDYHSYTNLSEMFRSDKIQFDNRFVFDKSYLKQLTENYVPKQSPNFDPDSECFIKYDNRIIYSLPAQKEQVRDNWLIYPGLNYFDFSREDGLLTTVKTFDNDRLLFLFDGGGPQATYGVDTLETDGGTKVLIGDGGLFARRPEKLVKTKHGYGSCQTKMAWSETQLGYFFPSQEQGRIFHFDGQRLREISRNGMNWWFKKHLPSKLLKDYPNFVHSDNTLTGVGTMSVFDNTDEIYYFTKIDYKVKDEWQDAVTYDPETDQWRARGIKINFKDPLIFEDASVTASYDPKIEAWVSFHDWHPNFSIQTENKFITTLGGEMWKHNDDFTSYCKFYGLQRSWEVELVYNNGQQTSTLSSLEYYLEGHKYKNEDDKFHVYGANFDEATIFNTEQSSGLLKIEGKSKQMISPFPIFTNNHVKVECAKVEQKYRINQFFDLTRDRGKNSNLQLELFNLEANGYRKIINKNSIDYGKTEKKKFRSNWGSLILRKSDSEDINYRLKLLNEKEIASLR